MNNNEFIEYLKKRGDEKVPQEVLDLFGLKRSPRWEPQPGELYYYVSDEGWLWDSDFLLEKDIESERHQFRLDTLNCFKTVAEAELKRNLMLLNGKAQLFSERNGWKPNWQDGSQVKWYFYYNHEYGEFILAYAIQTEYPGTVYFETRDDAEEFLREHEKEMLDYMREREFGEYQQVEVKEKWKFTLQKRDRKIILQKWGTKGKNNK